MQVEMFRSDDFYSIEEYTNGFIEGKDIVDIKLSVAREKNEIVYFVVIMYREEDVETGN